MKKLGQKEFIALMALLMSLMAFSIDAMLPALGLMATELKAAHPNDAQLVISAVFVGMSMGLMLYGPLGDAWGRKRVLSLGVLIFLSGSVVSLLAKDLPSMLAGRWIQGFGGAACRVMTVAIIRDQCEGREMARIMSLIMIVFILVPAIAPALGQGVISVFGWRAVFFLFFIMGGVSLIWFNLRQPESLLPENRRSFSLPVILRGIRETLAQPVTRACSLAAALVFGAFVGYLNSAQQILQVQYGLGNRFALCFSLLALAVGAASYTNSRLVMRFGMEKLVMVALRGMVSVSFLCLLLTGFSAGHPPFWIFILCFAVIFFCFGLLFGNINAMALKPLGHMAGMATSVTGTVQTLISVTIGGSIGYLYDGSVLPLVSGFFIFSALALLICQKVTSERFQARQPCQSDLSA